MAEGKWTSGAAAAGPEALEVLEAVEAMGAVETSGTVAAVAAVQARLEDMETQQRSLSTQQRGLEEEVAALRAQGEADRRQREEDEAQRGADRARTDAMEATIAQLQASLLQMQAELQRTRRRLGACLPISHHGTQHRLTSPQAELSSLPPRQPHPPLPADGIRCLPTPSHASAPHPAPSGPSCASTDTDANSRVSVVPRAEGLPQPAAGAAAQGGPAHRLSLQLPAVQSRVQSRAGQPHMGSLRQASTEAHSAQAPKSAAAPSRRAAFLRGRRPRFAKRTQGQLGAQAGGVQATGTPTEARRPSTVTV